MSFLSLFRGQKDNNDDLIARFRIAERDPNTVHCCSETDHPRDEP